MPKWGRGGASGPTRGWGAGLRGRRWVRSGACAGIPARRWESGRVRGHWGLGRCASTLRSQWVRYQKKFKRFSWGLAPSCQGLTLPPSSRQSHASTWVATRPRVPGSGPSPALLRAHCSPPWLPSPSLESAPLRSAPGASGFCAGSPGARSQFPGSPGREPRGGGGGPGGGEGGGGQEEEEEEEAGRRRRRSGRRRRRRAAAAAAASARAAPPPPPRERRAPRPGSHASHVRPLAAAAPRRQPRRVMRTDVKLPYEY